jgi:transmembrane sensor
VRALGTRFLVRAEAGRVGVAVLSGAVEAHTGGGMLERIEAREQVAISALGLEPVRPLTPEADAWVEGSLIVDNARLDEVIAELARYRRGSLSCDPAVAGLRVSGAFPVRDVDQALKALSAALPVRVERWAGFWTTVKPRGG